MLNHNDKSVEDSLNQLSSVIKEADAIFLGAGAGLSTSCGLTYSGERFEKYFSDFEKKYNYHDMYTLGFYPFDSMEDFWGYWCRSIYINRYMPLPSSLYSDLLKLVKEKDYFVLTTNVDHCFQRSGFNKERLFYTQGDYGLFQSSAPSGKTWSKTYDNYEIIRKMILSEGFEIDEKGNLVIPKNTTLKMSIPSKLVPVCPDDGKLMMTNLRCDETFVQDDGWYQAQHRYHEFLNNHEGKKVLFLELGVGNNTPGIIKYNFWKMTYENKNATYCCINKGEAYAPKEIRKQSICIDSDIKECITTLLNKIDA